ncbi:MAG: transposase [Deltaproteobacteria bacterium]|nr:transposase [Deltaproteobacteria bacterium]
MKLELSVAEANELIKSIHQPETLFEMIRDNVRQSVGEYLSELMSVELTSFLGRGWYERGGGDANHRNGFYGRRYTLKGIGEVSVKVPRDRKGEFKSQVIPRSKQYEDAIREDMCVMFLSGISTRTLALMSRRLIGRALSHSEVSKAAKQLEDAVEAWRERDLSEEKIKYMIPSLSIMIGHSP